MKTYTYYVYMLKNWSEWITNLEQIIIFLEYFYFLPYKADKVYI